MVYNPLLPIAYLAQTGRQLKNRRVGSWSQLEVLQMINAVRTVTGTADSAPGMVPWEAVAMLHPTRTWEQLCMKWTTVYFLHQELLTERGLNEFPHVTLVRAQR